MVPTSSSCNRDGGSKSLPRSFIRRLSLRQSSGARDATSPAGED